MPRIVNDSDCIGCQACIGVCPTSCITAKDDGKSIIDAPACVDCGCCEGACPVACINTE
ncbi:Ferrodoxin [Spironucleus salmonicida]|uniref:Ferrodoxin n=1 Tax=Spironucleus salmonicida TaxID=348837 RepID=V6LFC2_9EUKA|nr:Ferrodoxin [Spironucleus salmonicida]|eukprot:EST43182.1 Ferrodoxin [Spironucleus salmonicida]